MIENLVNARVCCLRRSLRIRLSNAIKAAPLPYHLRLIHPLPHQNTLPDTEGYLPSLHSLAKRDLSGGHLISPKNEDDLFDRIGYLEGDRLPRSSLEPVVERHVLIDQETSHPSLHWASNAYAISWFYP